MTLALSRIKAIDPVLLGLPPHPTAQEIAITEARGDLARAEKRLADLGKMQNRGLQWQSRMDEAQGNVKRCQEKVSALTGESFVLSNLGAKVARAARYIDPPQTNPSEVAL